MVPAFSRARRCLGVSAKSTGRGWAVEWVRQRRPEETHRYTATPGKSGVRASPKPQPRDCFQPPGPGCVLAFYGYFRRAVAPQNDSRQARQQMLRFNELQASERLFRGPVLSHRALYTAGTWLQWVTDPWPILTFAGLIHTRPHHDFSLCRWTLGTISQWEGLGKGHLSFCVVIKPGSVCQPFSPASHSKWISGHHLKPFTEN